ncbi:hypothetical protein [Streptomyces marokkonensis]|uniref:hypothetical protein n=1 Tax=Streptomyces marokkonensis TaxID=324855 RepID=UPI0011F2F57B|nr:hypothetical protein [Streptomyces marokkonensis]
MTASSSHDGAGSVLRRVLLLVAVVVSSLCMTGQAVTQSAPAEPASATVAARPAVPAAGPLVSGVAAEQDGTGARRALPRHEAADSAPSDTGHCGGQAAPDNAAARDGSRPSASLPTPEREEHRTPAAPAGPDPACGGPESAPPAPDPVRLSVLRI